jgi:hypothetical protein
MMKNTHRNRNKRDLNYYLVLLLFCHQTASSLFCHTAAALSLSISLSVRRKVRIEQQQTEIQCPSILIGNCLSPPEEPPPWCSTLSSIIFKAKFFVCCRLRSSSSGCPIVRRLFITSLHSFVNNLYFQDSL